MNKIQSEVMLNKVISHVVHTLHLETYCICIHNYLPIC